MADGVGAEDATNAYEVPDVGHPHIVVDVVYISLDARLIQGRKRGAISLDGELPFGGAFRGEPLEALVYFKGLREVAF